MNPGLHGWPSRAWLLLDRFAQVFSGGVVIAGEYDIATSKRLPIGEDPAMAIPASVTPEAGNGPFQAGLNNGAFTLNAGTQYGSYKIRLVNGSAAGAVTFSGFNKQFAGDSPTTTAGDQFDVYITIAGRKTYMVKALQ